MAEQTTSGGGPTPADDVPPTWMGPEEIGEEPQRSALVGTNRTEEPYRILRRALSQLGRELGELRAALEESDQLARAGETVGYESAYRILRGAVSQLLLEEEPDAR